MLNALLGYAAVFVGLLVVLIFLTYNGFAARTWRGFKRAFSVPASGIDRHYRAPQWRTAGMPRGSGSQTSNPYAKQRGPTMAYSADSDNPEDRLRKAEA